MRRHGHNHGIDNLPIFIGGGVPVVRVGGLVLESLEGQVLRFEETERGFQPESLLEVRDERFAREVEVAVNVVGAIGHQEGEVDPLRRGLEGRIPNDNLA